MSNFKINHEEIVRLYDEGQDHKKLAKQFNYSVSGIIWILKKYNKWITPSKIKDISGQLFGWLTAIEVTTQPIHRKTRSNTFWKAKCICGNIIVVAGKELRCGDITSCGCKRAFVKGNASRKYEPWLSSAKAVFQQRYSDGDLTESEFIELSQKPCNYCGIINSNSYNRFTKKTTSLQDTINKGCFKHNGLDRIDSSKPHNRNNVVPCCKNCNQAKMTMTPEKFKIWLKKASAYHLYGITTEQLDEAINLWKNKQ